VSFQLDRCQQLDSVTSAYHYRSSSSCLLTSVRSLRNKVDATSNLDTIHGIDITSAPFSWSTPLKSHRRLCTCLTARDWTAVETVWHSSTGWLTRALVMSSTCYGALENSRTIIIIIPTLPTVSDKWVLTAKTKVTCWCVQSGCWL